MGSSKHSLGDLQLAIMRVLWERGEATVAEVHAALVDERGLAPTTIATMLRKMEQKGVCRHRSVGRQFVYRSAIDESDVHRTMVGELVERLFDGDPTALVNHLVEQGELAADELDRLRRRIGRVRRKPHGGKRG